MLENYSFESKQIENNGKQYQFRRVKLEEYAKAAAFITAQAPDGIPEETALFRLQKSLETGMYEILGIFYQKQLVGIVGLWHMWRRYSGKSAEIDHMYVEPNHRGGLGSLFLDWVDEYLQANDYDAVELNAYVQNTPAHKFYLNRGFQILGFHQLKKYK